MIFLDTPRHRWQEHDTPWHFTFPNTSRSDLRFVECRRIPQSHKFHEIAHFTQCNTLNHRALTQSVWVADCYFIADGFSIGRYEKNRESFVLYAAKFESGAIRFWGEKSPRRWNPFKTRFPPLSFYNKEQSTANSNSFKIAQKNRFGGQKDDYTPQVR